VKKRPSRVLSALIALLAVLFSQLAVAAYACPGADGMRAAVVVDADPPCEEHPSPEAPAAPLCAAHCQQGDQSLDHRSVAVPAPALALPTSWIVARAVPSEVAAASFEQHSLLERPTGPPLVVRHCRFHI
jgi:hypothetical protein